ncbi:MAG TPA: ATPase, T2SS/T4P/T4SS family [Ilumatobacter sp.]|nr:ATPase, T2SS/T4P/T4SS family [Ilumatobacter sp.]
MTGDPLEALVDAACQAAAGEPGDVRAVAAAQVDRLAPLLASTDRDRAIERVVARLAGLDVLDEYLRDPDVDEVMVNAGRHVWVDRCGVLTHVADLPPGAVDVVLERVLAPLGKRLDRTRPIVDARLPDGARVCAVVAPVAVDGSTMSIRQHRPHYLPLDAFAAAPVARLLRQLVAGRANIVVSGATSAGKTTLLAALAACAPAGDRLVVLEDTTELSLPGRHAVRLEALRPIADTVQPVELADLVRTALRLRPDRLVVGEFRGAEVLAVVQALNTGHDGSLSTCHANSAVDALRRTETLVMQAAPSWPLAAIRRQVTRSLDIVVHVARRPSGERQVVEVAEVVESGDEPAVVQLADGGQVVAEPTRLRAFAAGR